MSPFWTVVIVILVILVVALIVLYIWGNKMQTRQVEQQALMDQMAQTVSILVIDKKRMKLTEANLPKAAVEQAPWYAKRMKVPVVKAKVQNRILTLMADNDVYEILPVKTEAKVVVSGIYITAVKSVRGASIQAPVKKGFFARLFKK
ncbi:MAG: hypothetical protein HFI93_02975 [Lachnospiraceae bacterium]|nr:hypothetical protein [Lachnospiraceae bacterium]